MLKKLSVILCVTLLTVQAGTVFAKNNRAVATQEATVVSAVYGEDDQTEQEREQRKHQLQEGLLNAIANMAKEPVEQVLARIMQGEKDPTIVIAALKEKLAELEAQIETADKQDKAKLKQEIKQIRRDINILAKAIMAQAKLEQKLTQPNGERYQEAYENLVAIFETSGDLDNAITAQEELVTATYQDFETMKKLGSLYKAKGQKKVRAFVNGKEAKAEVDPKVEAGTTLVPFRVLAEALDADVDYVQATHAVIMQKGETKVKLILNQKTAYINGVATSLDVPAKTESDRTLVPLRFISQSLGAEVNWDGDTQMISVTQ